jgi:hypothetical protein
VKGAAGTWEIPGMTKFITLVAWFGFLVTLLLPRFGITHPLVDLVFLICALTIFVSMVIAWKKGSS